MRDSAVCGTDCEKKCAQFLVNTQVIDKNLTVMEITDCETTSLPCDQPLTDVTHEFLAMKAIK